MSINMPSTATIECDDCGKEVEVGLVDYATGCLAMIGLDDLPEGWTGDANEQFCRKCSRKRDKE